MKTHFLMPRTRKTLCGDIRGNVTRSRRLADCPECVALYSPAFWAEVDAADREREDRLASFCRAMMGERRVTT